MLFLHILSDGGICSALVVATLAALFSAADVSFEMMSSRDFFVLSTLPDRQILEKLIGGDKVKRLANYVGMIEVCSSLKLDSMHVHEIKNNSICDRSTVHEHSLF